MALYVVTGPPASGKSTWVRNHAQSGDITIDFDALASVLTPSTDGIVGHDHPVHVKAVTRAARQAAIDTALGVSGACDVYVIHSTPSADTLAKYEQHGAEIITIDPGMDTVLARAKAERPHQMQAAVKRWYRENTGTQRDVARKIRSSHAWKVLASEFKDECQRHRNPDGTYGRHCHLCNQAIDYEAPARTPPAFEADHYQPVATRPDLAYMKSNLRPSHSKCNGSRGAKTAPDQGQWVQPAW
ncbi:ATP-binding protein [Mycobacterium hackensackense]|uniref:ATP-binding protein n=1 Tax=Mycobacterium hackensackense TaxID=228909 RepID=UPI002265A4FF|nr:ATP-binding protein [Mycobacterium hackensackense]